jgi:hypothetical protein
MSLLVSFAIPLQSEGCVALCVAVEAVEINVIVAQFKLLFSLVPAIIMVLLVDALHSQVHLFD